MDIDKTNAFLDSIDDNFKEKLPLTYRFVESMNSARNQSVQSYTPAIVDIKFYESKSIEPSGFYRPISKIVKLTDK
jgi:hypothetical protein